MLNMKRLLGRFGAGKDTECYYKGRLLGKGMSIHIVEAYGVARTNLMYLGIGTGKCSVVGVTGALPNEGKSLSCVNLAASFAALGKRVLVIDGDMRNASQHMILECASVKGLSEYLSGLCDAPEILLPKEVGVHLIVGGKHPPNAAELLYNGRFASLLDGLRDSYDVIFVDLPPVGVVTDAAIIAEQLDGYVMVVRAGVGDKRALKHVLDSQRLLAEKLLGFVLNGVEHGIVGGHKRGYSYYNYYSEPETEAAPSEDGESEA